MDKKQFVSLQTKAFEKLNELLDRDALSECEVKEMKALFQIMFGAEALVSLITNSTSKDKYSINIDVSNQNETKEKVKAAILDALTVDRQLN